MPNRTQYDIVGTAHNLQVCGYTNLGILLRISKKLFEIRAHLFAVCSTVAFEGGYSYSYINFAIFYYFKELGAEGFPYNADVR